MKTRLHYYSFNTSEPDQKAAHQELCKKLKGMGLRCFSAWGGNDYSFYRDHIKPLDGQEVELETTYLFNNQWNTGPTATSEKGLRVFDWAQPVNFNNKWLKYGHWLEQTPEMSEIRRNTYTCGFCGKQEPAAKGNVFCPRCLGSEYLKEEDLHLLRMIPVTVGIKERSEKRPELTEAEKAHLLPLYVEAQTREGHTRNNKRVAQKRKRIKEKYERDKENTEIEYQGFNWLLDHDVNVENCIFYSHTGRFCFGWQSPLDATVKSALLDILVEFPFDYDIKEKKNHA